MAASAFAARPMCRAAGPTGATEGRGATWSWSATPRAATWPRFTGRGTSAPCAAATGRQAAARGARRGQADPGGARYRGRWPRAQPLRPDRARPACGRGVRRVGRPRQQALRQLHPPGAALCGAGHRGRVGLDRAAPEAARRRGPRGAAERREVVASATAHPGGAEGRRVSVHHPRARAGHARRRGSSARPRRHPRPDRGRRKGRGAGHEFLAHVERCRVLVHLVDVTGEDPALAHEAVRQELREHGAGLELLPELVVLSKRDLVPDDEAEEAVSEWRDRLGDGVVGVVAASSASGAGIEQLRRAILEAVPEEEDQRRALRRPPPRTPSSRPSTSSTGPRASRASTSSGSRRACSRSGVAGSSSWSPPRPRERGGPRLPRAAPGRDRRARRAALRGLPAGRRGADRRTAFDLDPAA